jgi:hypothetical protein
MQRKLVMRSSVDVRSSAGSGDADATGPNTAQFAFNQVVGSTKMITVADQLHLSRFAGDIIGCYHCRDATKMNKRAELLNKMISASNHRCLAIKAQVKAFSPVGST